MKKIAYSLFAAAFVALSGCQDDVVVEEPVVPAQTGDEITFGSSLENTETTNARTIYGDNIEVGQDGISYYPVTWEVGDQIAIYCPQASNGTMVNYKVTPDVSDATHSSAVTKVNPEQAGLQWGDVNQIHHFSAFYPANQIKGQKDGKLLGEIPVDQRPVAWKKTINDDGTITYTGVANTDYAFMWAYNEHDPKQGGDVALSFKPWVTILDVEINGPENDASNGIKMSSVQLRATDYTTLTGDFVIDFTDVEQNPDDPDAAPGYEAAGSTSATRSQISIQLYANEFVNEDGSKEQFNDFITLKHGDKIVVRFYLLPKDTNYDTSTTQNLQLRVTPFNSSVLTRTLNAQGGTQSNGILAHKVNKVILPPVSQRGNNYWMSSLNPGIFITELSLPGSKFSYQNSTDQPGLSTYYQSLSVENQIKNGIRAFHVQTYGINKVSNEPSRDDRSDETSMTLGVSVAEKTTDITLKDMVRTVADGLKEAENYSKNGEYAFILLTYTGNASKGYGSEWHWQGLGGYYDWAVAPDQAWMQAVKNDLEEMAQDDKTYRLYTGEITPSTTLRELAGHVIIKVNYNSDAMANHLVASDRIPALFSIWGYGSQSDDTQGLPSNPNNGGDHANAYAMNNLRWGTSNHSVSSTMKFFYHEASSVGHNDNGGEETESEKKFRVEDMWNRSINYYKNNDSQSMWFMNDLGGYYINGDYSGSESQSGIDGWTQEIGPIATKHLQNRTEDATLGIVLINYANPSNQYSGNLIQTIINNNFNFQLRTDGSQQPETYSTPTRTSSNGWDE